MIYYVDMAKTDRKTELDTQMLIRLPSGEKATYLRAAVRDGRTLSGWVRHVLKKAAGKGK